MIMEIENKVRKELFKALRSMEQEDRKWKETVDSSTEHLSSVCNLCEQLRCCGKVNLEMTPLRNFTDLKERLQYKIIYSLEVIMAKLRDNLKILQEIQKRTNRNYVQCMEVYHSVADKLGIDKTLERPATEPSIADILEWLYDVDRVVTQEYAKRKLLLDLVQYDQEYVEDLSRQWKDSGNIHILIGNVLAHTSFFMAEENEKR
ncbi:AFG2-interacting ribosome maturation factor-like [Glandiceps talaboti]